MKYYFSLVLLLLLNQFAQAACPSGTEASIKLTPAADSTVTFGTSDKTVTVKNSGTCDITDLTTSLTGAQKNDFTIATTSTCAATLAQGSDCKLTLSFKASAAGDRTATLNITSAATGIKEKLTLQGTGQEKPVVKLSATSVNFGNQVIKTTSAEKTVTLKNTGKADLKNVSISFDGANKSDFAKVASSTCQSTLAAETECTIIVTFTPKAVGASEASLIIKSNADSSPNQVALKGTGTEPPKPAISASPTSVDFKNQVIKTTSAEKTITLKNSSKVDATGLKIAIEGTHKSDFAKVASSTCQTTLAIGTNCTVVVTFTPKDLGAREATLTVTGTDLTAPVSIALKGTGAEPPKPAISASPASVDFKNQVIKTTSAEKTITLKNSSKVDAKGLKIAIEGTHKSDFAKVASSTCQTTLAIGTNCTVVITFTPKDLGAREATLTVTGTDLTAPVSVALKGTGAEPPKPTISASPASVDFKNQAIKVMSAEKTITLKNSGKVDIKGLSISLGGTHKSDFSKVGTSTCQTTLPIGTNCTIVVTFTPKDLGAREGSVVVKATDLATPLEIALKGNGVEGDKPLAKLSPTSVDFKNQALNTTSAVKTITLKNAGKAEMQNITLSLGGAHKSDFTQTADTNCQATLAAGAQCTIGLTFTPKSAGSRAASLTVKSTAESVSIDLLGNGTEDGAAVKTSLASIDFAFQALNVESAAKTVTISNSGKVTLKSLKVTVDGTDKDNFVMTTTCTTSLAASAECTAAITFKPTEPRAYKANLVINSNAPVKTVALTGLGEGASPYADLGNGVALDSNGNSMTTKAKFVGGISVEGGKFETAQTVKLTTGADGSSKTPSVAIAGVITPDPEDIGKVADIFAYGFLVYPQAEGGMGNYTDCGDLTKGGYYMLANRAALSIQAWDGKPTTLAALDTGVTLAETVVLSADKNTAVYQGNLYAPGRLCISFGYRVPDGKIVFNGNRSVNVTINAGN